MTDSPQITQAFPVQFNNTNNDTSIVDIWLILRKRKFLFLSTSLTILIVALFLSYLIPSQYNLRTIISIGSYIQDKKIHSIQSPESTLVILENAYIPITVQSTYRTQEEILNVSVSSPTQSSIIIFNSRTTKEKEEIYKTLHHSLTMRVIQQHKLIAKKLLLNLESQLADAKNRLAKLQLSKMNLPIAIDTLLRDITSLSLQINSFKDTTPISESMLSPQPVSASKSFILLISILVAGLLGLLAVFLCEINEMARIKQSISSNI